MKASKQCVYYFSQYLHQEAADIVANLSSAYITFRHVLLEGAS